MNSKIQAVSKAYGKYQAALHSLSLGELWDLISRPLLATNITDVKLRMAELYARGKDEDTQRKFSQFAADYHKMCGSLLMQAREIIEAAEKAAREETDRTYKSEFEAHDYYVPLIKGLNEGFLPCLFEDEDDEVYVLYGGEVDKSTCPCVSREAVAATFEQLRDKFPDDDYGYSAILREHLRPATPEEIEHRGVLKKEGNKC